MLLLYIADINNDGEKEYVFTYPGIGSGGFINIFVFEEVGDKFVYLGDPPKPKGSGGGTWHFSWHWYPKTHHIQFLVNGCGSTYMQFDLGPDHKLEPVSQEDRANREGDAQLIGWMTDSTSCFFGILRFNEATVIVDEKDVVLKNELRTH